MKILIIDDEEIIRKLLIDVLEDEGHEVSCAPNGEEAIEKIRAENFNIIFSDVHMPEMNGLEAVKIINRMDSFQDLVSELDLHHSPSSSGRKGKGDQKGG